MSHSLFGAVLLLAMPAIAAEAPAQANATAAQTQTPAQAAQAAAAQPLPAQPFAVALPTGFGAFATQSQTTTTPDGGVVTTNWVTKAPTGEAVVVTVSKMPAKVLDPSKMIGGTRDALLKSLKATLESEEKIDGAQPATRLVFNNGSAYLRAHLLVAGDTLYQLLYVGRSADQRGAAPVGQLFDSFKLTGAATPAAPATPAAAPAAPAAKPAAAAAATTATAAATTTTPKQ